MSSTMGVVDELREMAREVVPDPDDQEERDIALGKFGSFSQMFAYLLLAPSSRAIVGRYQKLPVPERNVSGTNGPS